MLLAGVSRILSAAGWRLDDHSSKRPKPEACARRNGRGTGRTFASYLVLLRKGFALPPRSPGGAVGSCPTISPLPSYSAIRVCVGSDGDADN